jgi:DNA invertase Pin-like site-specific DNA recombinase
VAVIFSFSVPIGSGGSGNNPRAVAFSTHPSCLLKTDCVGSPPFLIDGLTAGSSNTHYREDTMKAKGAALYVRVSTGEQNTAAQERALREYVNRRGWTVRMIYRDAGVSGANASRPGLDNLLKDCRRGGIDVVVVWKFDRFARSLKTLISGLELCRALGIDFVSVTEAVDTSLPAGEMLFQIIGAVVQFERSLIAELGQGNTAARPSVRETAWTATPAGFEPKGNARTAPRS